MKTALTTEQSKHLIDLGVPKEKAGIREDMYGPALFKLEDFLNGEILPKEIMLDKKHGLDFGWDFCLNKWVARYCDEDALCPYEYAWYLKEELIDALYELACWYYGKYLKSEKK